MKTDTYLIMVDLDGDIVCCAFTEDIDKANAFVKAMAEKDIFVWIEKKAKS